MDRNWYITKRTKADISDGDRQRWTERDTKGKRGTDGNDEERIGTVRGREG